MIIIKTKMADFKKFSHKKYCRNILKVIISITLIILLASITVPTFAQNGSDSAGRPFHNDLLNQLVGKWDVAAIAHGEKFTLDLEADWVMNHQYMHIHFKSHEEVPWLHVPFEGEFFFGYNQTNKRYTVHEMTVHGDDGPYEGFCYAYQTGNEFKLMKKWAGSDNLTVSRFTWEPRSKSWNIDMRLLVDGKEGESLVDMKLIPAKPTSNIQDTSASKSSTNGNDFFTQMIDYSRPGKYHQLLADLAGNWTFKGRHFSGNVNPDSNKVEIEFSGTSVRRPFANGRFFIVELTSGKLQKLLSPVQDGKMISVNAKEITTEGYDNVKKKFVLTRIGNHIGSGMYYSEGDYDSITKTIIYERVNELVPEMKMKVREHFIILDNDHYTIEIYDEMDGFIIKDTELNYTRAKGK